MPGRIAGYVDAFWNADGRDVFTTRLVFGVVPLAGGFAQSLIRARYSSSDSSGRPRSNHLPFSPSYTVQSSIVHRTRRGTSNSTGVQVCRVARVEPNDRDEARRFRTAPSLARGSAKPDTCSVTSSPWEWSGPPTAVVMTT